MPIYEFYCDRCNMLFNFFSASIDTETRPPCPRCAKDELERRPARFAMISARGGEGEGEGAEEDELFAGLDEDRVEQAMESMAGEMEAMGDDEDPRQMARFFRRFGEAIGMQPGPRMEEMLARLESGADPDALEEEMEGLGDEEGGDESLEEWFQLKAKVTSWRSRKPRLDEKLYFL